MAHYHHKNTQN